MAAHRIPPGDSTLVAEVAPRRSSKSVYPVCMARVNVYLPDELAEQARAAGLNVSHLTQEALRKELAGRQTSAWLERVQHLRPTGVAHDEVIAALHAARDEMGEPGG
jgi:post-segregation antitoxin (ccd killing protein)